MNLGARTLDDQSVRNAGRAGTNASETSEATIDVLDERRVDRESAFVDLQNLVDAASGRVRFESEHAVRRALL